MKLKLLLMLLLITSFGGAKAEQTHNIRIEITQPVINTTPYHRPYVAIWLETPKRKGVATIALWYGRKKGDDKWLKDLRQWWRKIGRAESKAAIDAYSGATKISDTYVIEWPAKDNQGKALAAGEYLINVEASREDGGRDYLRQKITLGESGEATLPAKKEIGPVKITWN